MRDIPLASIELRHLEELKTDGVREARHLDYKRELPKDSNEEKKEFLRDVSSFANAGGGDIVYGVSEAKDLDGKNTGAIAEVRGLQGANKDADELRLQNILRTGISPRIPGVQFHWVDGAPNGPVLVLRIPRSWEGPHMVTFQKSELFFSRTSVGKYPLDMHQLRAAILDSASAATRARQFRIERVGRIVAGETPVPSVSRPCWCIHVIAVGIRDGEGDVVSGRRQTLEQGLQPVDGHIVRQLHNLDGFVAYDVHSSHLGYAQLFRQGAIEAVDGSFLSFHAPDIRAYVLEDYMHKAANRYVSLLRKLDVTAPLALSYTFLGVRGMKMKFDGSDMSARYQGLAVDRDELLLPEVLVEADTVSWADLRPTLDVLWQAAGHERCRYFDPQNGDRIVLK